MSTVTFQDNEYEWEDIKDKGRCLVPAKPRVKPADIRIGRRFSSSEGERIIIGGYSDSFGIITPEFYQRKFYGALNFSKEELANAINKCNEGSYFIGWLSY